MAPESRDSILGRPTLPNREETEENDLLNHLMQMIEVLKKEMRKSLKEIEEKAN